MGTTKPAHPRVQLRSRITDNFARPPGPRQGLFELLLHHLPIGLRHRKEG